MEPAGLVLAWVLAGIGLGAAATAAARAYALRQRLIDQPGERRSHASATPRGGGISIVLVLLVALAVLANAAPAELATCVLAGTGLVLVSLVGWIDDHRPLSAWLRLAAHLLAGLAFAVGMLAAGVAYFVGDFLKGFV